jgi:phosphate starvation-inducible PhoH-like protein
LSEQPGTDEGRRIHLGDLSPVSLFGLNDSNLRALRDLFDVTIVARGPDILLEGTPPEVDALAEVFDHLMSIVRDGRLVSAPDVRYAVRMVRDRNGSALESLNGAGSVRPFLGLRKDIRPKTVHQAEYLRAVEEHDLVFAVGPAGTGKTYLAVAAALSALNRREVDRILLVRPAVEAGESLGYLPGDFSEKVGPYLRPLYDALHEMIPSARVSKLLENETIEIAPLAYMRGRTLDNAFVILDEAQNTTLPQMKMFLTRLGTNSKAVITGDDTQIDLVRTSESGLLKIRYILRGVSGVRFTRFGEEDVVRHHLVQQIIHAFDEFYGRTDPNARGKRSAPEDSPPSEGGDSK